MNRLRVHAGQNERRNPALDVRIERYCFLSRLCRPVKTRHERERVRQKLGYARIGAGRLDACPPAGERAARQAADQSANASLYRFCRSTEALESRFLQQENALQSDG